MILVFQWRVVLSRPCEYLMTVVNFIILHTGALISCKSQTTGVQIWPLTNMLQMRAIDCCHLRMLESVVGKFLS